MRDLGSLWLCDTDSVPSLRPDSDDSIPITECHEWDGLFSIRASSTEVQIFLTAWCDGCEVGSFKIENSSGVLAAGETHVVHAPVLREPDGTTFPPGSHFGAGLWSIRCEAENSFERLIKVYVSDWDSTE